MSKTELLYRTTFDPAVLMRKPVIHGLRIPVDDVIRSLAADISIIAHLEDYTDLEREDIQAGLFCAAHLIEKERIYTIAK